MFGTSVHCRPRQAREGSRHHLARISHEATPQPKQSLDDYVLLDGGYSEVYIWPSAVLDRLCLAYDSSSCEVESD